MIGIHAVLHDLNIIYLGANKPKYTDFNNINNSNNNKAEVYHKYFMIYYTL